MDPPENPSIITDPFNCSRWNFIVIAHRALSDGNINLKDLCGASGRWDGIARCITSSLFLSHAMRRDTAIHMVLLGPSDAPKILSVIGADVKYLNPDERAASALMKKNLAIDLSDEIGKTIRTSPGIFQTRGDLEHILTRIDGTIIIMREDGEDLFSEDVIEKLGNEGSRSYFILSDDREFTDDESAFLESNSDLKISVGPLSLHTNQTITVVHNAIDRLC